MSPKVGQPVEIAETFKMDEIDVSEGENSEQENSEGEESSEGENSEQENSEGENSENEDSESEKEENEKVEDEKSGWADAMAKVLSTGKNTKGDAKSLFLSKAVKDRDRGKNKPEAKTEDGEEEIGGNKDENNVKESSEKDKTKKPESLALKRLRKKEIEQLGRQKPNIVADRSREKYLAKLATRGVVQLFNAVREQQKNIKSDLSAAGGSFRKRENVMKSVDREGFLEMVSGQKRKAPKADSESTTGDKKVKNEVKDEPDDEDEENESTWKILRDDFMMGAKMKDWDKESDSE